MDFRQDRAINRAAAFVVNAAALLSKVTSSQTCALSTEAQYHFQVSNNGGREKKWSPIQLFYALATLPYTTHQVAQEPTRLANRPK
jgi:hypothetical protein